MQRYRKVAMKYLNTKFWFCELFKFTFGYSAARFYHFNPTMKKATNNKVHCSDTILFIINTPYLKVYNSLNSLAINKVLHILVLLLYLSMVFLMLDSKSSTRALGLIISVLSQSIKNTSKSP